MAQITTSLHHQIVWEGGGTYCLVCLGALSHRTSSKLLRRRKPIDTFLKICELLSVAFVDIQQDWNFGGNANDRLPFCNGCLEVVHNVIDLQEQLDALQKKIIVGVESVRCRVRQSAGVNLTITEPRVHNFRSKVLGNSTNFPNAGVLNNVTVADTSSTSSGQNQVFTAATSWPFAHHNQPLYQLYSTQAISAQHINYVSPTSPPTSLVESATSPLAVVTANFATSPVEFSSTTSASVAVGITSQETVENTTTAPCDNFNTECFYGDEDPVGTNSSSGDAPSDNEEVSPSKRFRKARLKTTSKSRKRSSNPTRLTKSNTTTQSTSDHREGASRKSEYFAPVETDSSGKLVFEGITVIRYQPGGYQCGLCSAVCGKAHDSIALRKIKIHIKGFHLGAYKCPICSKNFTSNDILSQHITRTHEVGDKPCPNCGKPIRPRYMLLHQYTHMSSEEKVALIATGFKPPVSNFDKEKKIPCPKCGTMFKKMTNLRIHERTHMDEKNRPKHKCEHCGKSYSSTQSLKEHTQRAHPNPMNVIAELRRRETCKVCGKSIFSRVMARHMKTHVATENKPLACKICGKRFQDEKVLLRHEKRLHTENESAEQLPFSCEICGKRAATLAQIRSHRKRVHKNNLNAIIPPKLLGDISVDNPAEDFMLLEDLNREGLQHVEGNLYSYHLYEIKKLEGARKKQVGFQCSTCFKEFLGEGDEVEEAVKEHVRQEHIGNYRCNLCTKRMKNLTEVIVHKRVEHQNLDSYDCTICKKPGIPRKSIKGHQYSHYSVIEAAESINRGLLMPASGMVNHTDRKLEEMEKCLRAMGEVLCYKCGICSLEFSKLIALNTHRRQDHADKKKLSCKWEGQRKGLTKEDGRKTRFSKDIGKCPHCGKHFDKAQNLAQHVRKVHKAIIGETRDERKSRRGRKRKEERELESDDMLPKYVVKVEVDTDDDEVDNEEENSEEEDNDTGMEIAPEDDEDESDPEFRSRSKVKLKMGRHSEISLRTRRAQRTVNYAEDEDDEDEEDNKKGRKIPQLARRRGRPPQIPSPSLKSKYDKAVDQDHKEDFLLTEQDIKQSPHSSEAEDNISDNESAD